jgi:histone acetyltransferase (RNA polymerase elongator complex component)
MRLKELKEMVEKNELVGLKDYLEIKKRKKSLKVLYPNLVVIATTLYNPYNGDYMLFEDEDIMIEIMSEWDYKDMELCKVVKL